MGESLIYGITGESYSRSDGFSLPTGHLVNRFNPSRSTVDYILNPFRSEYTTTANYRRIRQSTRNRFFPFGFSPVCTDTDLDFFGLAQELALNYHPYQSCSLYTRWFFIIVLSSGAEVDNGYGNRLTGARRRERGDRVIILSACPCSLGLPTLSGLALGMRTQIAAGHPHLDLLLHSQYPIILLTSKCPTRPMVSP